MPRLRALPLREPVLLVLSDVSVMTSPSAVSRRPGGLDVVLACSVRGGSRGWFCGCAQGVPKVPGGLVPLVPRLPGTTDTHCRRADDHHYGCLTYIGATTRCSGWSKIFARRPRRPARPEGEAAGRAACRARQGSGGRITGSACRASVSSEVPGSASPGGARRVRSTARRARRPPASGRRSEGVRPLAGQVRDTSRRGAKAARVAVRRSAARAGRPRSSSAAAVVTARPTSHPSDVARL